MTERSPSVSTQIAPTTAPIVAPRTSISISANDAPLVVPETVEEEPYTIKCICDYADDDGSTVYCEGCDTWQHIECYYPGRVEDASKEEFDHSCADCKPRPLDSRTATDRQRHRRQNKALNSPDDKKTRKPPSKSHKKKVKVADLQLNGFHDERHRTGSVQDIHAKKSKGHRASQSMSKRSPPITSRPRPLSPASTPPDLPLNLQIHDYSDHFLALFDDEDTYQQTSTNSFASLAVSNAMSSWAREPAKLLEETGQRNFDDVSQNVKVDIDSLKWPSLRVDRREDTQEGTLLKWRSLINTDDLRESGRIGEITGVVGFQKDYYSDSTNRWEDCPQPRPFIFFCPQLPLFIDTRKEGSICRYVRRSCRPNTALELYIANEVDYHFWLISDRPLAANEQVTIPWEFNFPKHVASRYLYLLNLNDGEVASKDSGEITDAEYDTLSSAIFSCLSDHGGCACGLGNDCSFARFHRNYHGKTQPQTNGVKTRKGRKPKQSHISPTSTGHATNSRAASEGQDHYDDDDAQSQSDSARSKPQSRDMTPNGTGEGNGLFPEPSDREKRKLAALEDSFRKMEQQPARKKTKRASDSTAHPPQGSNQQHKPRKPSTVPRTSLTHTASMNSARARQYVDASTSRRQSGSPAMSPTNGSTSGDPPRAQSSSRPRPASVAPRPIYADSETQTDPVEGAWWESSTPKPKRRVISLATRLMKNRHKVQAVQAEQTRLAMERASTSTSPALSMDFDKSVHGDRLTASPTEPRHRHASTSSTPSVDVSGDVNMSEAPSLSSGNTFKPPPRPGQSSAEPLNKPTDFRVQMPAPPVFSKTGSASNPVTPSAAASSMAQSPFGAVNFAPNIYPPNPSGVTPNPVNPKKKLSLSEYGRMRTANKVPVVSTTTTIKDVQPVEDTKTMIVEGSTIVKTPAQEKAADPMTTSTNPT